MSSASTQRVSVSVTECRALMTAWSVPPAALSVVEQVRQQLAQGASATDLTAHSPTVVTSAIDAVLAAPAPHVGSLKPSLAPTPPLQDRLDAAITRYTAVARDTIQSAIVDALCSPQIGFTAVSVCAAEQGTAIEARRGDSVVQVVIHPDLRIDRDWALGPGDACVPLDAELTAQLSAQGITTTTVWSDTHGGRRDGAHLIADARAADPAAPARGAVSNLSGRTSRNRARLSRPATATGGAR